MQEPFATFAVDGEILASGENLINGKIKTEWRTDSDGERIPYRYEVEPNLRKTLQNVARFIWEKSGQTIDPSDISVHMNPNSATKIATSDEVKSYIDASPHASQSSIEGRNREWGLPNKLYMFAIYVKDEVRKKDDGNLEYEFPDGSIVMRIDNLNPEWSGKTIALTKIFG